jgi:hypothetical protein
MAHLPIDSDFLALSANWPPAGSDEPAHGISRTKDRNGN